MAKYTKEMLEGAAENSLSIAGVLRNLGLKQAGGTQAYVGSLLKKFGVDTSHFTGQAHNKGTRSNKRKSWQEVLVLRPEGSVRVRAVLLTRAMLEYGMSYRCSECGLGEKWNEKKIVLHVDHIDGEWLDNRIENVRFLCPNCHSQTETYCRQKHASVVE